MHMNFRRPSQDQGGCSQANCPNPHACDAQAPEVFTVQLVWNVEPEGGRPQAYIAKVLAAIDAQIDLRCVGLRQSQAGASCWVLSVSVVAPLRRLSWRWVGQSAAMSRARTERHSSAVSCGAGHVRGGGEGKPLDVLDTNVNAPRRLARTTEVLHPCCARTLCA